MTVRFPTAEEQERGLTEAPSVVRSRAEESLATQTCVYCKQGQWTSRSGYTAKLGYTFDERFGGSCFSHSHCSRKRHTFYN